MTTVSATERRSGHHAAVRLVLGVVAMLTCLWSYAAPAHALPAPMASTCAGVWVVVDYGSLGSTSTACAGSYSTGTAALRSAGFTPTFDAGLLVKIKGLPAVPNVQVSYWSYWHATRQADGSYSAWSYSSQGPSSFAPSPSDAEGWRYASVSGGNVPPGAAPPKQTATTQAPATTKAATTARTTAATKVGTTAAGQTTAQAASTTAPDSPTASVSSVPAETPSDTSGATGSASPTVAASAQPISTSTGSLLGGVGAIVAIAIGAAGTLIWRKRVAARG